MTQKFIKFTFLTPDGLEIYSNGNAVEHLGILPKGLTKQELTRGDLVAVADGKHNAITVGVITQVVIHSDFVPNPNSKKYKVLYIPDEDDALLYTVARIALSTNRIRPIPGEKS